MVFNIPLAKKALLQRFFSAKRDEKGAIAVEFALVLPVIVFALFGAYVIFDVVRAAQRVDDSTAIVGDLVTRDIVMTEDRRDSTMAAAQALLADQFDAESLDITISSLVNRFDTDGDDTIEIIWSISSDDDVLEDIDNLDVELPTIPEGESVIAVQIEGSYTPPLNIFDGLEFTLANDSVRRPRFTGEIPSTIPGT